ncbi:Fc.00g006730.m01.CDS01 [Cosmosporella sp. VM-42]
MHRTVIESPWPSLANDDSWTTLVKNGSSGGGDGGHGGKGEPGEDLRQWSSLIGIVTAIVGNVLIALALNVQRYAHIQLHKERHRNRRRAREALKRAQSGNQGGTYGTIGGGGDSNGYRNGNGNSGVQAGDDHLDNTRESDPLTGSFNSGESNDYDCEDGEDKDTSTYLKSPYWWLGQVLITLGEMGNFLAYGFAPASIVSPLGVVALISNCIIAPAMFHERFRQRDFWGVVIAVGGVVTVVLSAKGEETKLGPHDVWDAITTLAFEIYLAVTIFLIITLMWASSKYGRRTILIDLGLVGLFGGYTALATKGVSSMLSSSLWRAFTTPVTYALIVVLLATAIMQIRYVNKALQRFDSTQVIPIQFVMFTLCVILGSAVLYRDFERTTAEQAAKFVGGCLLTFFGVFLITSGRQQSHDDDDILSEAEGVEETIGLASQDGNAASSGHGLGQDAPTPISQSRRSSKLSQHSYAETVKTLTPQHEIYVPSVRILEPNGSHHSPGQEAPIHNNNPWQDVGGPSTPPGRGIRTYSTDSVSAGAAIASTPASMPATPMKDSNIPPVYPTDGSVMVPRPGPSPVKTGTHHRSRTFISPSPLSSTVTAVVKDAFLRTADDPRLHTSSMRRIRSSIRASLFFSEDDENAPVSEAHSTVPASDDNLVRTFSETEEPAAADADQVRRRSRSVSDTLGDFFRVRRKKRKDDYSFFTSDVEDGGASTHPRFDDDDDNQHQHRDY